MAESAGPVWVALGTEGAEQGVGVLSPGPLSLGADMNMERIETGAEEGSGDGRSCPGQLGVDGAQDTLPPNIAPWHIQYFKLKGSEKAAGVGRSLSLPSLTLRQVIKPSWRESSQGHRACLPAAAPLGSACYNSQLRR